MLMADSLKKNKKIEGKNNQISNTEAVVFFKC